MMLLPSEYFQRNFVITTSGVCSEPALKLSLEVLGAERVLFAADYPYESVQEAVSFLDNASISDEVRAALYWRNASKVFHLR
jgi:5-carboxyvanillate decarboxylase